MKRHRLLLLLLIPILLAGCETLGQRDRTVLRAHNVPPDVYDRMLYGDPLSLEDVIALSQRDVPPGLIIHYMDETEAVYRLRKADAKHLEASGVDPAVVSYMLSTAPPYGPYAPVAYGAAYPPYAYPYYAYGYYYGGPYLGPALVFGGGYYHWGHRGWDRHR
jgi:hypothetical protein